MQQSSVVRDEAHVSVAWPSFAPEGYFVARLNHEGSWMRCKYANEWSKFTCQAEMNSHVWCMHIGANTTGLRASCVNICVVKTETPQNWVINLVFIIKLHRRAVSSGIRCAWKKSGKLLVLKSLVGLVEMLLLNDKLEMVWFCIRVSFLHCLFSVMLPFYSFGKSSGCNQCVQSVLL